MVKALALPLFAAVLFFVACSDNSKAINSTGTPPDGPCGPDYYSANSCKNNANLPGCFICARIPNDAGAPLLCEIPCRIGMTDCPAGQTCLSSTAPPSAGANWSGCNGYSADVGGGIGYCH